MTQAEVAKELGLSAQQIANWKRQFTRLSDKQCNTVDGVDYPKQESEEIRRLKRENKRLQEEMDFLKKAAAHFGKKPGVKYAIMRDNLGAYSKSLMSIAMGVSRSGFNKWLNRPESPRARRKSEYTRRVRDTYEEFEAAYGGSAN